MKIWFYLITIVCLSITLLPAYAGFEYFPDGNTLALWHMNEGAGDKIIDASQNGFDGEIEGKAEWGAEDWKKAGVAGKSFAFDGSTAINIGNIKELINLNAITVEAWVFAEDLGGWHLICCNWAGPPGAYHFGCENAVLKFHITTDNGTAFAQSAEPLEVGEWYHTAGTYDSTTGKIQIYVNGKPAGDTKHGGKFIDSDYDVIIGSKHSREFKWKGFIDEVRISDIVRTQKELSINLEKPGAVSPIGNLILTWGSIKSSF